VSLHQTTVLKTYLKAQDKELISKQYKKYSRYFHNEEIQKIADEIDEMVFDLYGVSEDERKIVRGEGGN
jgi:spore coat polysaccharide biosynthesis predicted glycosyltransferase SpsG